MLGDVDRVDITSEQITRLIVFATHGRLREIRKLLVRWVELGFRKKSPSLTQKDLAQAFVEVIFPDAPPRLRKPLSGGLCPSAADGCWRAVCAG